MRKEPVKALFIKVSYLLFALAFWTVFLFFRSISIPQILGARNIEENNPERIPNIIGSANSEREGMLIPKKANMTIVISVVNVVNSARLRHWVTEVSKINGMSAFVLSLCLNGAIFSRTRSKMTIVLFME